MRIVLLSLILVSCGDLPRPSTTEQVTRVAASTDVDDDEPAVADAQTTGNGASSTRARASQHCADIGSQSVPACQIPFGQLALSTTPAASADTVYVDASGYGSAGAICEGMHTFMIDEGGEPPWSKIWAAPAGPITSQCDCENTEVVLTVRGARRDNNVWCGYACDPAYAYCDRATYCNGNCPSYSLCRFEGLPNLTLHQAEVRARGAWVSNGSVSGVCMFAGARMYRDMIGPYGVNLDGAIVAASAVDLRTGDTKAVRVGYRGRDSDGHAAAPTMGCCGAH